MRPPATLLRTAVAAALIVGLAAGMVLLAWGMTRQVGRSIKELRGLAIENRTVLTTARALLSDLEAAISAQRGFLLTTRPDYLPPFRTAEGEVTLDLDLLATQARTVAWLRPEAEALGAVARDRMGELEAGLRLARTQGVAAALDPAAVERDRRDMAGVRAMVGRIVARADADAQTRTVEIAGRERQADRLTLTIIGGGMLLLALAALGLLAGRRRLLRAQAQTRIHADRLVGAVAHIRDGVAVFDVGDRLLLWNEQFFRATSLPGPLAAAGTSFSDIVAAMGPWVPPLFGDPRPDVPNHPRVAEMRHGGHVLEVWRSLLPDGGQMVAVADITRREKAESTLRQAQKMDVLGQMTGGVAHDFNNLLQVISANLELIGSRLPTGTPQEEWLHARLQAALTGVARGASLTRHLLAFARRQPLAPEAIDLATLLGGARDLLARLVDATIRLEIVVEPGLWAVLADARQLENALLNLVANARDAMPEGGLLRVAATNAPAGSLLAPPPDRAKGGDRAKDGDYVELAVTDTGTGMTEAECARAVEPFYTTKPEGRGTGLGLSMVYGFVEQSGGLFRLESVPERGTTVRLWLPRTLRAAEPAAPATAGRLLQGRGETVLLVEDDPEVRASSAGSLRSLGYAVAEAEDAGMALQLLEAGLAASLLFSDVILPGAVSSSELAKRARALLPDLAVLFTSGYASEAATGKAGTQAALLGKPWRIEDLAERIRTLIDTPRPDAPSPARVRVVLAEDEPIVRMTASAMLADAGHTVMEAADAGTALRYTAEGADILVTDLGLPDMNGRELVRLARAGRPGLPVVIASGHPAEPDAAAEGIVWLQKPFDQARLQAAVQEALREAS